MKSIQMMAGRWAVALLFLLFVAERVVMATDSTCAESIASVEQLAAKVSLDESHLDIALAAGRVVDPDLDTAAVKRGVAVMAEEVRKATADKDTPQAKVTALNEVIFQIHGFSVPGKAAPINSGFAVDLYGQLAKENPGKNLFFSPYSMSSALAMTAEGALKVI